jgi:predicted P-loop ATPase
LWAEAVVRFQAGAVWWLETPELEALATAEQAARFEVDAWDETVSSWLVGRNDVSVGEVLVGALGVRQESRSQTAARPKFSTAESCLPLKCWTNFLRRCPTKPMIRPKTGRLVYERNSFFRDAPQTSAWLCRGP